MLAEAAAWVWIPPEARTVDDRRVPAHRLPGALRRPDRGAALDSERPADELIDDVLDAAHGLGRESVNFFELSDATRPPDLEPRLRERGAELTETLAVLALDLARGVPDLDVPPDLEVRRVADLDDLRATDRIDVEVFGGSHADEEALALAAPAAPTTTASSRCATACRSAPAGHVVAGETIRLWGGAVVPAARHTGAYRALLDHRLRAGVEAGCTMALVKGRVETSAPVLLRAGFQQYGEVRAYRLARG